MKKLYILLTLSIISNQIIAQNKSNDEAKSFTIKKSIISTEKSEFSAVLTGSNHLYFTKENTISNNKDSITTLDIYKTSFDTDGVIDNIIPVNTLNTKWHDGPVTITSDGKTMYFSSESFNVKKGFVKEITKKKILKKGKIYLFKATLIGDEWSNIISLPINNPEYSNRNPSISTDGKTLYFSSNRPGGHGGEDLWKVSIQGNSYNNIENLGAKINSSNNESFPCITDDNQLYYSSDSPDGLGGLDVYKVNLFLGSEPQNLKSPINSSSDDFSFNYNDDKKIAFFSSNRDGNDDIFIANLICKAYANITIKDNETGEKINNTKMVLSNNKNIVKDFKNSETTTRFTIDCDKDYSVTITKAGYNDYVYNIEKPVDGGELNIDIKLDPNKKPIITATEVILQPIYFDFNKSNITEQGAEELNKLVTVMNEHPDMVLFVKSHTDNKGNATYNLNLSNKRANATVEYILSKGINSSRISGKGFGETELKVICNDCTEEQNIKNRRSEFKIISK